MTSKPETVPAIAIPASALSKQDQMTLPLMQKQDGPAKIVTLAAEPATKTAQ